MKKNFNILLLTLVVFLSFSSYTTSTTQIPDTRSVVKALYIYTFATLVEWPEEKRSGNFIIGVYGEKTGVYDELVLKYSGKSIGSQKIIVTYYSSTSKINDCHILYITEGNTSNLATLAKKQELKTSLLLTENSGALSNGAVINFIVEGNQQKYEINARNAKKHKLVIAKKLADLAAKVIE